MFAWLFNVNDNISGTFPSMQLPRAALFMVCVEAVTIVTRLLLTLVGIGGWIGWINVEAELGNGGGGLDGRGGNGFTKDEHCRFIWKQ